MSDDWRDIETAPKDGTPLLLYVPPPSPFQVVGLYFRDGDRWEGWVDVYEAEDLAHPSHWMPLPEPPKP